MTSAIAKKPLRQVDSVKSLLQNDQARQQLSAVAAKHMNPERLMRVTANAIRTTPKLQECEPLSFLGGLMQCAALGLEPNTVLGHAYLIPFENRRKGVTEVQVVVGYKGLIDLARRSGHITSISANIHYSDDELWEYEEGTEARLRHRPGPQEGEKLHAYAIAKFTDGGHAYVVLPWAQVLKIRNDSQGYKTAVRYNKKDSPWMAHEDAMAKKTAIRALAKYLPLSVEFVDAVQIDNDAGTRVDYASFAMNPEDGTTIDGEFIEEEGEPASSEVAKSEVQAAPTEAQPEKSKATSDIPDEHLKVIGQIEQDLADGAPAEATADFYADALEKMKAESPEAHKQALAAIESAGQ
jgi:recombination protein RecT